MLEETYELLVDYIEEMIDDGVQLAHGGHLIDWSDTKILKLIQEIRRQQGEVATEVLAPGDLLQNKQTGQKVAVIYDDGKAVHLNPVEKVLVYPKSKFWQYFQKNECNS